MSAERRRALAGPTLECTIHRNGHDRLNQEALLFVRWRRRPLKGGGHSLDAIVVQSQRSGGKVRQRTRYLAGIREDQTEDDAARVDFWLRAEEAVGRLDAKRGLDEAEKKEILRALRRRVKRPSIRDLQRRQARGTKDLAEIQKRVEALLDRRHSKAEILAHLDSIGGVSHLGSPGAIRDVEWEPGP